MYLKIEGSYSLSKPANFELKKKNSQKQQHKKVFKFAIFVEAVIIIYMTIKYTLHEISKENLE